MHGSPKLQESSSTLHEPVNVHLNKEVLKPHQMMLSLNRPFEQLERVDLSPPELHRF